MSTQREVFASASEIEDPVKRKTFFQTACSGNKERLRQVQLQLDAHEQTNSFLGMPTVNNINPTNKKQMEQTRDFSVGQPGDDPREPTIQSKGDFGDSDEDKFDLSFLNPSTKLDSIGSLGHFEILEVLGRGGFGIVFKAFDEKLHRLVAIKVMDLQMASTSPPRKRFLREARSAAAIKHENIVQVYSVEEQPIPYMIIEYINGLTLQEKLDGSGPLDTSEVLYLGVQIASGLAAAHANGLIHRDIKPGNILLEQGAEQKVKIADFGLARAADDAKMTRTGLISGTPLYMSPEQALGQRLDHRSDLFSLGSVLYQMACGRVPFRAPTAIAVLGRVARDAPRPMQEIVPEVPDWLVAIVDKLHAKKPEDRFQTAKEVADLFARYQSEILLHGKVKSFVAANKSKGADIEWTASRSSAKSEAKSTSRKLVPLAISAVLILVLISLVPLFLQGSKRDSTQVGSNGQPSISIPVTVWHGWPADAPPPAVAPFNAQQAKRHQESWAKYLGVTVEYTNSLGMKFVLIPPGEFTMGSTPEEITLALRSTGSDMLWQECIQSEGPRHKVILTRAIYMGVHEVTQGQFEQIAGENPSCFGPMGTSKDVIVGMDTTRFPVERVSWNEATKFCSKLGEVAKLMGRTEYRLPTDAEWEFACRAGTTTDFWIGENSDDRLQSAWTYTNSGYRTHAVGELRDNPFGLYDVHGNVWEWVQDAWDPNFYGQFPREAAIDPLKPSVAGSQHVTRGGNWSSSVSSCRSSSRCPETAAYNGTLIGFRVTLSVEAVKAALKATAPAM